MKHFLRWLANIAGSVVAIALLIMFFPHITQFAKRLMPDESGAAIRASAVIATKLENGARLETLKINEQGVLDYDIRAAFLGSVANLSASYTYEASFGIDLEKVALRISNNEITFLLPMPELIQDSLTPTEVYSDDFWYPGFTKADFQRVMEEERIACREAYLVGEKGDLLLESTLNVFEETITAWIKEINHSLTIHYEWSPGSATN